MIEITNIDIFGWDAAIRGMRNPMNSWDRSDSYWTHIEDPKTLETANFQFFLGDRDHDLMMTLAKSGTDHAKFRRMIHVQMDILAPLYWWKEFDTYKVGTVANSCSTMHKIHAKEFDISDFSYEHLDKQNKEALKEIIFNLNVARNSFNNAASESPNKKNYWWQMIQLLPTSYNQLRTVDLNYEVLSTIYKARLNHKLDEWHDFCRMIENLPHRDLITVSMRSDWDSRK